MTVGEGNKMFTRNEASILSGLTVSQLLTLERNKLITPAPDPTGPEKTGSIARIYYNWSQIVELRGVKRLRESCTLAQLKKAVKVLDEIQGTICFSDKRLIAYGNQIFWIDDNPQSFTQTVTQLTGKNPGQILLTFTYGELISDLWERADDVIDFRARALERPSLVAV